MPCEEPEAGILGKGEGGEVINLWHSCHPGTALNCAGLIECFVSIFRQLPRMSRDWFSSLQLFN